MTFITTVLPQVKNIIDIFGGLTNDYIISIILYKI